MVFDAIFLSLFLGGWAAAGGLPWLVLSIKTRGQAGLQYLPLCIFTGLVAGLAVPIMGLDNWTGFWLSFAAAFVAPSLLLAVRRFSLKELSSSQPAPSRRHSK